MLEFIYKNSMTLEQKQLIDECETLKSCFDDFYDYRAKHDTERTYIILEINTKISQIRNYKDWDSDFRSKMENFIEIYNQLLDTFWDH